MRARRAARLPAFSGTRSTRLATLVVCLLPAFSIGTPTTRPNLVASFFFACPGENPAPRVRTKYTAMRRPARRPKSSPVDVFQRGHAPMRKYQLVGEVDVLAHSSHTNVDDLTHYAIRAAREMGGDALVDVWLEDAASAQPRAGEQGMLCLTAGVARWE